MARCGSSRSESVRRSAGISRLDAEITELRAGLGLEYPDAEELAGGDIADRLAASFRKWTPPAQPIGCSPGMGALPDEREDWESYLR